jgi:heme/copper-type cytochrome/quinol oxidase subunit 2
VTRPSPSDRNASQYGCVLLCLFVAAVAVAADPPQKTFILAISRGAVANEQRVLRVDKGDLVRIRLTTDAPGEVHIHGYRLETKVVPGSASDLGFTARTTGRYRIEWHPAGEAPKGDHHGPPLARLEVRPK